MLEDNFIGNRINELRLKLNFTMGQLAELINTSPGYISDIEKGKALLSIPKLLSICQAFNITLSEFFNDGIQPTPLTPELKSLLDSARELAPEQLQALTEFIKTMK